MCEFKYKQALIVRVDLKMSKGKTAAQVAHAAVSAAEEARVNHNLWWKNWIHEGQKKVVLKVNSLEELIKLKFKAAKLNIPYALVEDKGLTEIPPGSVTCLGIGPAPNDVIDAISGSLPLL